MAENIRNTQSVVATATYQTTNNGFPSRQFTFAFLDSNGQLVTTTNGGNAVGVVQDKPKAGEPGSLAGVGSRSYIQAGGTFAAGDPIATNQYGQAIPVVTGDYILGYAFTAGQANQIAEILFQPLGSKR